jgi:LacI family transcriptional regulator
MVTLKDVAHATGLGLGTVSRALSGHPQVTAETRRRVADAARRIGYQPNVLARSLRKKSSEAIGLVIPDLENDFYMSGAAELQAVLDRRGYRLVICSSNNDPDTDAALLVSLAERQVDGIAHVPCSDIGSDVIRGVNPDMPVVEYARRSSSTGVDAIVGDEEPGARQLVEHLIGLGHRHIAMLAGPSDQSTTRARVSGFTTAISVAGLNPRECPVVHGSYDPSSGEAGTRGLLDTHPRTTAIFASSSRGVLGAFKALADRGLSVPRDMSLVGFLNPRWFEVAAAPVTTFELPLREMGSMVADRLLSRIESEAGAPFQQPRTVRLEGRLIIRGSTAEPRGAHPSR